MAAKGELKKLEEVLDGAGATAAGARGAAWHLVHLPSTRHMMDQHDRHWRPADKGGSDVAVPAARAIRAAVEGPMAALDERPRPGKTLTITAEAKARIKDLACRKAKELAYPYELGRRAFSPGHAREHGPAEGHGCLAKLTEFKQTGG
jgi:hypothetical protein